MPDITITVTGEVAERLAVLISPDFSADGTLADVVAELVDHAQQAVYRPGAWERAWLCQAFGYDWLERVVPDTRPESLNSDGRVIFDRPGPDSNSIGT